MSMLNIISLAVSIWLGSFLVTRGEHPRLKLTGFGLLFYAAAIGIDLPDLSNALRLVPPVLWVGGILHLDQRIKDNRPFMFQAWKWFLVPITFLLFGLQLFDPDTGSSFPYLWINLFLGLSPLAWTFLLIRDFLTILQPRQIAGLLFTATIFFGLGEGFLLFPTGWFPQEYLMPAIGVDLFFLGFCIAWFDAFDEGEIFLPEMFRSFVLTAIITIIFAGQVGYVIAIQTGPTEIMLILLKTIILASVLISVFGPSLQNILDGLAFSGIPSVRDRKKRLATESGILSRRDAAIDLSKLNEEQRTRLTRRALSHYGDLTRLASNPLTQLPVIDQRLASRNTPNTTIDRANELKLLLSESILRLKPQGEKDFDTTDAWRYYNAVFFPYIAGLHPFSRTQNKGLMEFEQEALEWFQAFVPERTLHNWQNAAAKLIANDLWEKNFTE